MMKNNVTRHTNNLALMQNTDSKSVSSISSLPKSPTNNWESS